MFTDSEWDTLTRYFTGECSSEEREEIEAWIESDPRREARVEELERMWALSDGEPRPRDVDAAWDELREGLEDERRSSPREESSSEHSPSDRTPRRKSRSRLRSRQWISTGIVALSLLLVAAAVFLFRPDGDPSAPDTPRVVSTDAGERTQVLLADSSVVQLNAESELTVSPSFGEERRVVHLQGEAYFDVTSGSPFVVKARDTRVRVLGTAFGVRSYSTAEHVSVLVAEGKVGVDARKDASSEQTLGPTQRAVVSSSGGVQVTSNVPLSSYLGWRNDRLVFRSTPLRSVMRTLERQYGLETFLLDDALADRELTATFTDKPLSEVLHVISLSLDVGFRQSDSTVVFGRPERTELNAPSPAASPSR